MKKLDTQSERNQILACLIYTESPYSEKIIKNPLFDELFNVKRLIFNN